jgi:hypothetical protein
VAGHDPIVGRDSDEISQTPLHRSGDHLGQSGGHAPRRHTELQVPHRMVEVPGVIGPAHTDLILRVGDVTSESLGADPPAVTVGADSGQGLEVGQGDVAEGDEVVVLGGAPVIPQAQAG